MFLNYHMIPFVSYVYDISKVIINKEGVVERVFQELLNLQQVESPNLRLGIC
jgi:hypothetical protein